jgi:hypothetical protein
LESFAVEKRPSSHPPVFTHASFPFFIFTDMQPSLRLVFSSLGLLTGFLACTLSAADPATAIDRHAVVSRHNVHVLSLDPESSLSVGNGDFAFTVDATGLQSFEDLYHEKGIPLETLSTWAWHSFPNTKKLKREDASIAYSFHGRSTRYAGLQNSPAGVYFRQNPHPLPLGQLSLLLNGKPLQPLEVAAIDQKLDLWTGLITSRFVIDGQTVIVETAAHPNQSLVSLRLRSSLLAKGALSVRIRFPYSYNFAVKNKPPLVWNQPGAHSTTLERLGPGSYRLLRKVDESSYVVSLRCAGQSQLDETQAHEFTLTTKEASLSFSCLFSQEAPSAEVPDFPATVQASADGWKDYWTRGGAVDFAGSKDPRASELERRIVLSRYLMKVNYAGAFPPAESGLTHLSWFGKHNSEMYFWHAAQFCQWGHPELLERGLDWYRSILPQAKADAAAQGFDGARWPKMTGPDGLPAPGSINPFIIWNQPNPIYLAELIYRTKPTADTLARYSDVVFESAKFLASFAYYEKSEDRYVLGPPIKNVSEQAGENTTQNPTFELAYWYYGLSLAQEWRKRLGLQPDEHWNDILKKLSKLPVSQGRYLEIETVTNLYEQKGQLPTSMTLALGYLPQTEHVDPAIMKRTFDEVNSRSLQGLKRWVSWSMGQGAMTAARLGERKAAVDIVTNDSAAARFMPNGHVRRPKEPKDCPAFLPVNSSFLSAVALMLAGWDGSPMDSCPGFPNDGSWTIKWEGLNRMP